MHTYQRIHALRRTSAGDAGLRKGAIAALEWADIDLLAKWLTVRRNAWYKHRTEHVDSPKSGRERSIDLTDRLVAALKAHRHLRGPRVLVSREGKGVRPATLEYAIRSACRKAGLRQVGWHALRHTFCSHLAMSGPEDDPGVRGSRDAHDDDAVHAPRPES